MRRNLVLFVAAAGRILAPARRFFWPSAVEQWPEGPDQAKKASLFLRRAEQTCELRNIAPQRSCGGPKDPKKKQLP
ncbi:hypothetical protein SGRA_3115 [Saprospira grandis str. Lewin]|uniref:Uncharacterized protein n=1 Tax=Saprospira grandis (strain Lewin) TaxID=984262 RepID=H6KZR7_SAPGL|nr:hypothetical protein SGRA_3115 [Saprospira grandis str. Lewin]